MEAKKLRGEEPVSTRIVEALQEKISDLQTIYLFGSRADSSHLGDDSDWDIAVLSESYEGYDTQSLWEWQSYIAAVLCIDLDLIDLRNVSDEKSTKSRSCKEY